MIEKPVLPVPKMGDDGFSRAFLLVRGSSVCASQAAGGKKDATLSGGRWFVGPELASPARRQCDSRAGRDEVEVKLAPSIATRPCTRTLWVTSGGWKLYAK